MPLIYNVTVSTKGEENLFHIEWTSPNDTTHIFDRNTGEIMPEEMDWMWKDQRNQPRIGEKLFRFLDGQDGILQKALIEADNQNDILQISLSLCKETANWPFELLAQNGSFLLPERLDLIRRISFDQIIDTKKTIEPIPPQDRALKLLFMASAPLDEKKELDFEKEEEAIFKITEQLAIEMEVEDTGSLAGLRQKLDQQSFNVIHLSGFAGMNKKGQPYFVMEDETGYREEISAERLWKEALSINPPHLIFLSGNDTGEIPGETEAGFAHVLVGKFQIPALLGWGRWISDNEANEAATMIYKELSRGNSIPRAVRRARHELFKKFPSVLKPSWPQLRLFGNEASSEAIVTKEQKRQVKTKRMTHIYLQNSQVKVLLDGFVGRRRQLQQAYRALINEQGKVGLFILGTGGLGKSCLAGKISERFSSHTLITVHGKLNSITMKQAIKDAFFVSGDEYGQKVLNLEMTMEEILGVLSKSCFTDKRYLFLLDDFEQNLAGSEKGEPGPLLPESGQLLKALLVHLPGTAKTTQLMITCRYGFSLPVDGYDLVKEKLECVRLSGFRESEQRKKMAELPHILGQKNPEIINDLLEAGCGNPRLMEWIDILVGKMGETQVDLLKEAVKGKRQEFIQRHVIKELLEWGGKDLNMFMQWFSIYRIPVLRLGAEEVAIKAGVGGLDLLLLRGMELSLIENDQARMTYQVTPLLRDELLSDFGNSLAGHEAAFVYYKKICEGKPEEQFDPIPVEEWVFHALEAGEEDVVSKEGGRLVGYLGEKQAFGESKRIAEWILREKKLGLSTENDAFLLNEFAFSLRRMGEARESIKYYSQALIIDEEISGRLHLNVSRDLNNLGEAWRTVGEPEQSIKYFQEALDIDTAIFKGNHPRLATRLNNLGSAWENIGDHDKAIEYYQKALNMDKAVLGEEHPSVAIRLNNLGIVWKTIGEYQKAIDYYTQAQSIDVLSLGQEHPDYALDLNNLGAVWQALGDCQKAIYYFREAQNIDEAVFGKIHPSVARDLNNMGTALKKMGEYRKAIDYYLQCHNILVKIYGDIHPQIAVANNNLGLAYVALCENENAKVYFEKAYEIRLKLFGPDHPGTKKIAERLEKLKMKLD